MCVARSPDATTADRDGGGRAACSTADGRARGCRDVGFDSIFGGCRRWSAPYTEGVAMARLAGMGGDRRKVVVFW